MTDPTIDLALSAAPRTEPELVSVTAAPGYVGLPVTFQVIHHGREWTFPTADAATTFVSAWHPSDRPHPRSMPCGGDGRPVLTCAPDSVFVNKCTSTRWVDDRDEQVRNGELVLAALAGNGAAPHPLQGNGTTGFLIDAAVVATQARWLAGGDAVAGMGGFRIECVNPARAHEGRCGFATWSWDWRAAAVSA